MIGFSRLLRWLTADSADPESETVGEPEQHNVEVSITVEEMTITPNDDDHDG